MTGSRELSFNYIYEEWLVDASNQVNNFSAISWREQVTYRWDVDDDVCFVQDQHASLVEFQKCGKFNILWWRTTQILSMVNMSMSFWNRPCWNTLTIWCQQMYYYQLNYWWVLLIKPGYYNLKAKSVTSSKDLHVTPNFSQVLTGADNFHFRTYLSLNSNSLWLQ